MKVTASVWVPFAAIANDGVEIAKGGGRPFDASASASPELTVDVLVARVTFAVAFPVFVTLKFCDAALRRLLL